MNRQPLVIGQPTLPPEPQSSQLLTEARKSESFAEQGAGVVNDMTGKLSGIVKICRVSHFKGLSIRLTALNVKLLLFSARRWATQRGPLLAERDGHSW